MSRKGCGAAPAILVGAQILGLLRSPFAAQGRSYTDRVDGIDMGMGELCVAIACDEAATGCTQVLAHTIEQKITANR